MNNDFLVGLMKLTNLRMLPLAKIPIEVLRMNPNLIRSMPKIMKKIKKIKFE